MDPESLLRERLARLAARPLARSLEDRVLSRTTRRSAVRGSRVLAMGAALSTALVVGGVLYGVASLGRHPSGTSPQGAGHRTPVPSASVAVPSPTPTPRRAPSPTPTRRARPLQTPSATPTPPGATPSPTATAPVTPAPTAALVLACDGRQLTVTVRAGPRNRTTATSVYVLENVGTVPCTLRGVPALRLVGAGGSAVRMVPVRARSGRRGLVTLQPRGRASFVLRDQGCRQATTTTVGDSSLAMEVTLPGAPGSPLLVQGGLVCGPTTVEVSAIVPGIATPRVGPATPPTPSPVTRHHRRARPAHRATPTPLSTARPTARPTPVSSATPTPRSSPQAGATPTPTATPSATPTPTPSAAPTPTPLCAAADLQLALYSNPIAAGSTSVSVGLTNDSPSPCLFIGAPTLSLLLANGTTVPVTIGSTSYNPDSELVLAAAGQIGADATGAVIVLDLQWPSSALTCAPATGVVVTAPFLGTSLVLRDLPVPACAGAADVNAQLQTFGT